MEMSSIQSSQVTFKAQPQATAQTKPTVVDKIKNMDDKEKLTAALAGLGALGLGALLYAKGKGHKANEVVGEVVEEVTKPKAQEAVAEATEKATRTINLVTTPTKITAKKAFKVVDETCGKKAADSAAVFVRYRDDISIVDVAQSAVEQGYGISGIKKEMTRNLSNAEKKAAIAQVNEGAQKGRETLARIKEAAQKKLENANNAGKTIETINQQIRAAQTAEEIQSLAEASKNAAKVARQSADELKAAANDNPTHRNIKRAKIADNKATRAALDAKAVDDKALDELMGRSREEAAKARKLAEQPQVQLTQEQLEKQAKTAEKGAKTTLNKFVKQKTAHGKMTEKQALEAFVKDSTKSEAARKIAQERLASLK
ncbi:MAG: hypothetical protein IJW73_09220 [Candidatus Gastranaerophilales bacterium]|nr:hypothetical protein [Candidatus Gastranaerophilales bacterium]